jgi:hypothetical protein
MKECFDLTRIRIHDPMRMSSVCYHRANAPCNVSVLIYIT